MYKGVYKKPKCNNTDLVCQTTTMEAVFDPLVNAKGLDFVDPTTTVYVGFPNLEELKKAYRFK